MKRSAYHQEELCLLESNLDDMNPELFPWVLSRLFEKGALDCWATPIIMKHGRPAFLLSALCREEQVETLSGIIFEETTALGIRLSKRNRLSLEREVLPLETPYGQVGVKVAKNPSGEIVNALPEFRDCAARAEEHSVPLKEVYLQAQIAERRARPERSK